MTDGRWAGRWWEWACPGCGAVLQALQAPQPEEARCLGCRARTEVAETLELINRLSAALDQERRRAVVAELERDQARRELAALRGGA